MSPPSTFLLSQQDQPHPDRTRAILKAHPEVRRLMGRNVWTAAVLAGLVLLQIALAVVMGRLGVGYWWLALVVAYAIGAFANHSLYVIVHEATHNLIFANRTLNRIAALVADLPNLVPGAIGFGVCHLKHHSHQGDYDSDADIASRWEARFIGNRWYTKAFWLLFFPFFQVLRPPRLRAVTVITPWTLANLATAVTFDVALVLLFGWNALIYLAASMLFSVGLHPLGARWIQEHYTYDPSQETFSYYGPLNLVALNVGYHNEHHDFPSIPWNRLPRLKAMAPEFYDTLRSHRSWSKLLWEFLMDPRYSLFSRILRVDEPAAAETVSPTTPAMAQASNPA
jgi:sphingolipid delta-4 desaturase